MSRALSDDLSLRRKASTVLDKLDEGREVGRVVVEVELGAAQHEAGLWIADGGNVAKRAHELVLAPGAGHALDREHDVLVVCARAPLG